VDVLALTDAMFEILSVIPSRRITVKERYEMKKKRRELQRREKQKRRECPAVTE
jgi:hypothetical protein